MLMDNNELENLWFVLREYASAGEDETSERIDYDRFCQISVKCAELFGEKSLPFFTPSTFLKFRRDELGCISILPLFHYIMRKVSMQQTRIYLSYHDSVGDGYLRESDLDAYITQMLPSLPPLAELESNMVPQYKRIAIRKLMFFNDPHRRNRVSVTDLLVSPQLAEFLELRQEISPEGEAALSGNWFSLSNARRVYSMFLELDEDMDGMLSIEELALFGGGGLTKFFLEILFEEHIEVWNSRKKPSAGGRRRAARNTRMDFPAFLEFVLAWENRKHEHSLAYFFRIFDRRKQGFLTSHDLFIFFRYVHERWVEGGNYELNVDDVKDELWDMIKPEDPLKVTLKDLVACKMGDTVISILTDITGFWAYDSREMLMQEKEEETEE